MYIGDEDHVGLGKRAVVAHGGVDDGVVGLPARFDSERGIVNRSDLQRPGLGFELLCRLRGEYGNRQRKTKSNGGNLHSGYCAMSVTGHAIYEASCIL